MLRNQIYYRIKPWLPRPMRLFLRRRIAERKRQQFSDVWPIHPDSACPPAGWPGWPEGKRFAFVLTHDVEGRLGRDRCCQLMEVEKRLGFKSSFNFVPENGYLTPKELRDALTEDGFEVGVHDLKHNGKLYFNRETFKRSAARINEYLKDWNAVGFRSGLMHHNLDWIGDLDMLYDASTFDTDPFEPQPDGAGTIFPFWVTRRDGRTGYVELPYTLPQDFTLFVILKERTVEIWKKKLDWIAARGGMALMSVHPDYIAFNNKPRAAEYPVAYYEEFLTWVKEKYAGQYYHALPRDIAAFTRSNLASAARASRP